MELCTGYYFFDNWQNTIGLFTKVWLVQLIDRLITQVLIISSLYDQRTLELSGCILVASVKRFYNLYSVCTGAMLLAIECVTSVKNCLISSSFYVCVMGLGFSMVDSVPSYHHFKTTTPVIKSSCLTAVYKEVCNANGVIFDLIFCTTSFAQSP